MSKKVKIHIQVRIVGVIFFILGWARQLCSKKVGKPFTHMKGLFSFRMGPKKEKRKSWSLFSHRHLLVELIVWPSVPLVLDSGALMFL